VGVRVIEGVCEGCTERECVRESVRIREGEGISLVVVVQLDDGKVLTYHTRPSLTHTPLPRRGIIKVLPLGQYQRPLPTRDESSNSEEEAD